MKSARARNDCHGDEIDRVLDRGDLEWKHEHQLETEEARGD